jgi:hypothetical protein
MAVGEVLQALLAEHYVKGAFSERQFGCAPLVPRDLRIAAGGGQHALVDIDSGDRAELSADQIDTIGDKAGAAADVEDMIAIPAFGRKDEIIRPRLHDLQRKARVGCRRIAAELPSTRFTHWSFSSLLLCNRLPDTSRTVHTSLCDTG